MKPCIVLNMIVKNEAAILGATLANLRPHIDAWVICDTGSTDGTQDIIRAALNDLPGQLHERPWVDFAHNRSEALAYAAASYPHGYALIHDADDVIDFPEGYQWPELTADSYYLEVVAPPIRFMRTHLLRLGRGWKYKGVVHEVPVTQDTQAAAQGGAIAGLRYRNSGVAGARSSDPAKYARDAALLQADWNKNPGELRTLFYLAQSLKDAGFLAESLRRYEERAKLGGWEEEVFVSLYEAARLRERLAQSPRRVVAAYRRAWERRPTRAEPLYELARYLRTRNRFESAYRYARRAARIARPADILFVYDEVYACGVYDELALAAHYTGRHEEAVRAIRRALQARPSDLRLQANLRHIEAAKLTRPALESPPSE